MADRTAIPPRWTRISLCRIWPVITIRLPVEVSGRSASLIRPRPVRCRSQSSTWASSGTSSLTMAWSRSASISVSPSGICGERRSSTTLPISAGALQVPVVHLGVVGDQQLDHGVVEVRVDLDVAVRDLRGAQVQHDAAAVGAHLELALGGPVPEPLERGVVRRNPDRSGRGDWGDLRGVHGGSFPRSAGDPVFEPGTRRLVDYDYP